MPDGAVVRRVRGAIDRWLEARGASAARRLAAMSLLLAVSVAVPATAAHRLPEWGRCRATGTGSGGRYGDPGCVVRAGERDGRREGAYEWFPLPSGFRLGLSPMTPIGPARFQTAAGKTVECSSPESSGTLRPEGPAAAGTPLWELKGCQSEGRECHSQMAAGLGEITDSYEAEEEPAEAGGPKPGWTGRLGFVTKSAPAPTVGILYTTDNRERLTPAVACAARVGTIWFGGYPQQPSSFIAVVTPIDTMSFQFTETYSESAPGVQSPDRLAGHAPRRLLALIENHWEPLAISATFSYEVEGDGGEGLEIKAVR